MAGSNRSVAPGSTPSGAVAAVETAYPLPSPRAIFTRPVAGSKYPTDGNPALSNASETAPPPAETGSATAGFG